MRLFTNIFLAVCLISWSARLVAQDLEPPHRPKVGVVLSGGGAKGLAHIGALKVIEEAGIHIDYIGGTSMGAIIGGLYASGYTADQLDSIFSHTDFNNLIQDNLPRDAKSFFEKKASERYALTLPFDKFKVSVPQGYSGGQNVYNELVRALYHVRNIQDFNDLPVPFLCIATDVETGGEVRLDEGYLPEMIMASGTLPTLFEPSIVDGEVLIDGGVVNNYPVDEVRNMGADVVIGVDVQHGLRDRSQLQSATEILLQINNYRTALDMKEKAERTDIYIKPDIDAFTVIDFAAGAAIIKKGEEATRIHLEELTKLASDDGKPRPKVTLETLADSLYIDDLKLNDLDNYTRGYIKGKLRFDPGHMITFKQLQEGINNLSATGNFKSIRYTLGSQGEGEALSLQLHENPNKRFLRLSAHFDNLYKTAALINYTHKRLLMKDDVASFDFIIGDNIRYDFQYLVDRGSYWSFGWNSRYNTFKREIGAQLILSNFDSPDPFNVNSLNIEVGDFTNQLFLQTLFREEFAITLGLEQKYLKYSTKTLGSDSQDPDGFDGNTIFENSNYISGYGQLVLDTYDDRYFPSKGLYFDGDFHFYLFSSDYLDNFKEFSVAKAKLGAAFPIFPKLSMNIETEGGFKLGTSEVTSFDFVLGGYGAEMINNFKPFLGYDFLSLPGNSFVKSYGRLDLEFLPKNHLLLEANFANVDDDLFRTGDWFDPPSYSGYGLGYGWESFLGPIQVLYSWSPEIRESHFFFSIGYWF